jgi:hypothetical protein
MMWTIYYSENHGETWTKIGAPKMSYRCAADSMIFYRRIYPNFALKTVGGAR